LGCFAGGYANNSGMIQTNDNNNGSFVFGIAGTTGEVHLVDANGSANFGRNNAIMPSGQTGASGADYSFAMGNNALAYMQGSMAHSSFPGVSGPSHYGQNQFVRVLLKATNVATGTTGLMVLGDGNFVTLPYNGVAITDVDIIGFDGSSNVSSTKIVFTVQRSSGTYGILATNSNTTINHGSANVTYVAVSEGLNGFTVGTENSSGTTFNFCGTFNITMFV